MKTLFGMNDSDFPGVGLLKGTIKSIAFFSLGCLPLAATAIRPPPLAFHRPGPEPLPRKRTTTDLREMVLLKTGEMKGFTLLELMVALAVLATVSAATWGVVIQTETSVRDARSLLESEEVGGRASELLSRLLESLFFRPSRPELTLVGWSSAGRGPEARDGIRFATASRVLGGLETGGGLVRCSLELREERNGGRVLVLEAAPALAETGQPMAFVLTRSVGGLDFAFLVGGEWLEEFDSEERRGLPEAIRVSIYQGGELRAERVVTIGLAERWPVARPKEETE